MNNPEYDFKKHVKVPEEWIEKALAVPDGYAKKPRAASFAPRRIAAAASIALVLGLSLYAYFLFENINSVPAVLPSPTYGESGAASAYGTEPAETAEHPTDAPSQHPSDSAAETVPAAEDGTLNQEVVLRTGHDTEAPTVSPSVLPTEAPTQPETSASTEPRPTTPLPTAPQPTQCTVLGPDEDPLPSEEVTCEIYCPFEIEESQSGYAVSADELSVYCRVYGPDGRPIGDSEPYSDAHKAVPVRTADGLFYLYVAALPAGPADGTPSGYAYEFYDRRGNVLYSGEL